jgi:hypothetical protein
MKTIISLKREKYSLENRITIYAFGTKVMPLSMHYLVDSSSFIALVSFNQQEIKHHILNYGRICLLFVMHKQSLLWK